MTKSKHKIDKNETLRLEKILQQRGLLERQRVLRHILAHDKVLSASKIILISLLAAGALTLAVTAPGALRIFQPFLNKKYAKRNTAKIKNSLYGLKNKGSITIERTADGWVIRLTKRGREKALRFYLNAFSFKHKKWDGKWRIVIFDIPVRMNRKRDALREFLKNAGFREIQKSVYAFPYPCWEELNALLEYLRLNSYVRYCETTFINQAETLRRAFHM